jgi:hypothetical protein
LVETDEVAQLLQRNLSRVRLAVAHAADHLVHLIISFTLIETLIKGLMELSIRDNSKSLKLLHERDSKEVQDFWVDLQFS